MTFLPTDKIRVFISSRLGECTDERQSARGAIVSLDHEPILFEDAGARSHAPRSVYLRGLDDSNIFVGIYREGYGYIAEGMDISGIEDEYRYAKIRGIPQLLYVLRNAKMETRQKAFVDNFTDPSITINYYEDPSELAEKIRNDLSALVAEYFQRGQAALAISPPSPGSLANELAPQSGRIRRTVLEEQLLNQLESTALALVTGPLGAGKTVFLSTLAEELEWAFIQCADRSPREIVSDAANNIRSLLGLPPKGFLQMSEAQTALQAAWQACTSITLILDDVRAQEAIEHILSVIELDKTHRMVVASRERLQLSGREFALPPLDIGEIKELILKNRPSPIIPGEIVELQRLSQGSPLYLRYYLNTTPGQYENTISDYELKAWYMLPTEAQEALSYLAWTTRPLTLDELSQLLTGAADSIEKLAQTMESARSLLVESNRGYAIFHPHATQTIRGIITKSSPRLNYYTNRLSKWFSAKHDYTAAFNVLDLAGFDAPNELLEFAGRHASVQGDAGAAMRILNIQIAEAHMADDTARERDLLLLLAQMQSHAGQTDESLNTIQMARSIQTKNVPPIEIDEMSASILALTKGDVEAFKTLKSKKSKYSQEGYDWDAARLALDISVYQIRQGEHKEAANEAEYAMRIFQDHDDSYGLQIAKMNLLSAISCIPERTTEANTLMHEIESANDQSPRQRAFICNVLGRGARERNDIDGAKNYAHEAIEIGRNLEDAFVVCNNLINLGNAYRQEKNWEAAIAEYEAADKIARESHIVIIEASAQELMASVFNRNGKGERAVYHATYAISLVKDGVAKSTEIRATEELAQALELTGDDTGAREAWLKYADLEIDFNNDIEAGSYGFIRAVSLLHKQGDVQTYINSYRNLFTTPFPNIEGQSPGECLIDDLVILLDQVSLPYVFDAAVYHSRLAFNGLPKLFIRQMFTRMMKLLFDGNVIDSNTLKRQRIALALSMAVPPATLTMGDIVDVGEHLTRTTREISFRAHPDGAAHWVINMPLGKSVIVTISQLDDRPDVSLITLCIALVLISYGPDIYEDVLSRVPPIRNEAYIQVSNFDEAKELLPLENIGLSSLNEGCEVTRATDIKTDTGAPIFVVTSNTLTEEWLVGLGKGNSGQELFAKVLVELVYHLQSGEIELESLYPKVITVIKKTIV